MSASRRKRKLRPRDLVPLEAIIGALSLLARFYFIIQWRIDTWRHPENLIDS